MKYWISENVLLPLQDLITGERVSYYFKKYNKLSKLSRDEIIDFQTKKLLKLINHAYQTVPFYQKRFKEADLKPENIKSVDDLKRIPPLTRKDIQNNGENILSGLYKSKKLNIGSSSGSTGVPVFYYKDFEASSAGKAAGLFGWSLSGWRLGMRGLHIWGNPATVKNEWGRPGSKIKAFIFNHHKFPAYKLTSRNEFKSLTDLLLLGKYEFIDGYTNAIYLLSDYMRSNKICLKKKLNAVLTTAENLQDFQRDLIQEYLGPVFDGYGCGEINGIAYECIHCTNYHIIDPHVIVEFGEQLTEAGEKELIITDLDNYAFPLIRYKNGDVGVKSGNATFNCVNNYSTIYKISGRQSDMIHIPGEGYLSIPSFFGSMLLRKVHGIRQYQILREKPDLLLILLVITTEFKMQYKEIIEDALNEYLGGKINYRIEFVDKIEIHSSGKHKLLIDKTVDDGGIISL